MPPLVEMFPNVRILPAVVLSRLDVPLGKRHLVGIQVEAAVLAFKDALLSLELKALSG